MRIKHVRTRFETKPVAALETQRANPSVNLSGKAYFSPVANKWDYGLFIEHDDPNTPEIEFEAKYIGRVELVDHDNNAATPKRNELVGLNKLIGIHYKFETGVAELITEEALIPVKELKERNKSKSPADPTPPIS